MRWDRQNLFVIAGFRYIGLVIAGVRFHIFYCNSAGLSNVVRYDGVFVTAGFVITGCHCTRYFQVGYKSLLSEVT